MPKKRQNRGRHKGSKGHTRTVQCDNCGRIIPRDKAICVTRWYTPVDPQLPASSKR
ncbi:MAG TPA: 30S ribosomal protein S26e, partial [Pyrodictium sp.]|nr:30S ribosomal protein S26e [Pyrodictium sp.]